MAAARVYQAVGQILTSGSPAVRAYQCVMQVMIAQGPAPPPTPPVVQPFVITGGRPTPRCSKPNQYDACLTALEEQMRRLKFPPLCAMPKDYLCLLPWDDHAAYPEQAVPFRSTSGITTPAPAAGDQTVVTLKVPLGYDGIITALYQNYSGSGFDQGSGDIIWRLQLNRRYAKDLSNLPFSLGIPQFPFPLTEGQIIYSGMTARLIVNVPNLSGMIQVGQSTVFGGLLGFFWPR